MPAIAAFEQLENIRARLPAQPDNDLSDQPKKPTRAADILSIAEHYDSFFFDAFGVLNVGAKPIAGAIAAVSTLRKMGKNVFVLSNAASVSKAHMVARFAKLGYDFSASEIITSRDAVLHVLETFPKEMIWGLIGLNHGQEDLEKLHVRSLWQDDPDFLSKPDGYLFLATANWDKNKQQTLLAALRERPRPIILGNPDLIAPMGGHSSIEPGSYMLLAEKDIFEHVIPCGKPFASIFNIALERLQEKGADVQKSRILMCGDTLHTDILGANAAHIHSALLTEHGFYKGLDEQTYIRASGIIPNWILPQL